MQLIHLPKIFPAPIANGRYSECCRCITSTTLWLAEGCLWHLLPRQNLRWHLLPRQNLPSSIFKQPPEIKVKTNNSVQCCLLEGIRDSHGGINELWHLRNDFDVRYYQD